MCVDMWADMLETRTHRMFSPKGGLAEVRPHRREAAPAGDRDRDRQNGRAVVVEVCRACVLHRQPGLRQLFDADR